MSSSYPFPLQSCHSEERGDGFSASRPLASGDLVMRVAPWAGVPCDAHISRVCASCFRRDETSKPVKEGEEPEGPAASVAVAHRDMAAHGDINSMRHIRHVQGRSNVRGRSGASSHENQDCIPRSNGGRRDLSAAGIGLRICRTCMAVSFRRRCRSVPGVVQQHCEECHG